MDWQPLADVHPLAYVAVGAVGALLVRGLREILLPTVVIVLALGALTWFASPGGQPWLRAAFDQPTTGTTAACVVEGVVSVRAITSEHGWERVDACQPTVRPAPEPAPPGAVEDQAGQNVDAALARAREAG